MAIPTQFSVTNKAKRPISNPSIGQDSANLINAESIGFISGASSLLTKAPSETDTAFTINSEALPGQDSAQVIGSQSLPAQDSAVIINSQSSASYDGASLIGALTGATITNPSLIGSQSAPNQDDASALPVIAQPAISEASAATAKNTPSFSAPSALTPSAGTDVSPPFPLNHARILYDNVLLGYSAVNVTNAENGAFALTPNTWQRWTVNGGGSITITLPFIIPIDTICIGAHTLGDGGYSVGAEWSSTTAGPFNPLSVGKSPDNNNALMFYFSGSTVNARRVRIILSGGTSASIGYISAGISLQMQRPFFNDYSPYIDNDKTEYYAARTESGERIGRTIRRKGFETTYNWSNLDDGWYEQYIPDFKKAAKRVPVFLASNLLEYPDDVAFGDITEDFSTTLQNGTNVTRVGLSFTIAGVG